jgi:hypothetical protein
VKHSDRESPAATIFTPGIAAKDCIKLRQQLLVAMPPTKMVSLAANPLAVNAYRAVTAAATPCDSDHRR